MPGKEYLCKIKVYTRICRKELNSEVLYCGFFPKKFSEVSRLQYRKLTSVSCWTLSYWQRNFGCCLRLQRGFSFNCAILTSPTTVETSPPGDFYSTLKYLFKLACVLSCNISNILYSQLFIRLHTFSPGMSENKTASVHFPSVISSSCCLNICKPFKGKCGVFLFGGIENLSICL